MSAQQVMRGSLPFVLAAFAGGIMAIGIPSLVRAGAGGSGSDEYLTVQQFCAVHEQMHPGMACPMLEGGMGGGMAGMGMDHSAGSGPTGQAAFDLIASTIAALEADPGTDWTRVNIEALRAHLMDMEEVTLRARVVWREVPGGAEFEVFGTGPTVPAIHRMTHAHVDQFGADDPIAFELEHRADGVLLRAIARNPGDAALAAKIRGLGFVGLLTLGDHHGPHHAAMAGGTMPAGHQHE